MPDDSLRVVVVTGASRGIGKAVALALGEPGSFVYVNFRSKPEEAAAVVTAIQAAGGQAEAIGFDVADSSAVDEAFDRIAKAHGGVDVLVSNAGIAKDGLVLRTKSDDVQAALDINIKGALNCTRAALKTMLRRKGSRSIVYMSSVVGQMGNAGQAVYSATKAGLIGLMKSVAKEVASREITVNAIAPGFVETDMTSALTEAQRVEMVKTVPLGRTAKPEEIATVAKFLASPRASYITGQVIAVSGGMYL